MAATSSLATIDAVLKDDYASAVQFQLNDKAALYECSVEGNFTSNGKKYVFPIHVGRNDSAEYIAEGGTIPVGDNQKWADGELTPAYMYGTIKLTAQAIENAKGNNQAAFVNVLDTAMTRLVTDLRQKMDKAWVSGGRVKAFGAELVDMTAASAYDLEVSGDLEGLQTALTTHAGLELDFILMTEPDIRTSTTAWTAINTNPIQLNSVDLVNREINVTPLTTNVTLATTLSPGDVYAVKISETDTSVDYLDLEPVGIFGNLAEPTHFTLARDGATVSVLAADTAGGNLHVLRTYILGNNNATGGTGTRSALDLDRLDYLIDLIANRSGEEPGLLVVNRLQRSKLFSALRAAGVAGGFQVSASSAEKADAGFKMDGATHNGIPILVSQNFPNGIWCALNKETWKRATQVQGEWVDTDGSVLRFAGRTDEPEAWWRGWYQTACIQPNANGLLVGMSL